MCGHPGDYVCSMCEANFIPDSFQSCPHCGAKNADGKFCDSAKSNLHGSEKSDGKFCGREWRNKDDGVDASGGGENEDGGADTHDGGRNNDGGVDTSGGGCAPKFLFDQLIVSMDYGENALLRKTISLFKYDNEKKLHLLLSEPMKKQFFGLKHTIAGQKNILFVPVPLHKKKLKRRGFNQALLLAKEVAPKNLLDCLERKTYLSDQAKLAKTQRLKNLKGSIRVKEDFTNFVKNKSFVVVDDVATTGSTLNECAGALKNCGAKYVCGLVLARVR